MCVRILSNYYKINIFFLNFYTALVPFSFDKQMKQTNTSDFQTAKIETIRFVSCGSYVDEKLQGIPEDGTTIWIK